VRGDAPRDGATTLTAVGEGTFALVETRLGAFAVEATTHGVVRVLLPGEGGEAASAGERTCAVAVDAAAQIARYARGERETFDVALDWEGVPAEHRHVLETLVDIAPFGQTVTYGVLGARSGVDDPREVGVYMNRNPFPILIPCHRVVASDGLGGYGGGLALKRRLLELEGALPPSLDLGDL
jgi:methylated-DNA-[protein]-cysteine S-methyltransferase